MPQLVSAPDHRLCEYLQGVWAVVGRRSIHSSPDGFSLLSPSPPLSLSVEIICF